MDDPRMTPEANNEPRPPAETTDVPTLPRAEGEPNITPMPRMTPEVNERSVQRREDDEDRDYPRRRSYRQSEYRKDREHLNLLSIFYFVKCGLQCFGIVFAGLYMVLLIVMGASGGFSGPPRGPGGPPPG